MCTHSSRPPFRTSPVTVWFVSGCLKRIQILHEGCDLYQLCLIVGWSDQQNWLESQKNPLTDGGSRWWESAALCWNCGEGGKKFASFQLHHQLWVFIKLTKTGWDKNSSERVKSLLCFLMTVAFTVSSGYSLRAELCWFCVMAWGEK